MRELARSLASFSWAMSLLGLEQMTNLIAPRRAAAVFGTVARAAEGQLGPTLGSAFQSGEQLQRRVVDAAFDLAGLGSAPGGGGNAPDAAAGAGTGLTGVTADAGSGLLNQVGGLAFGLLQLGVDTVYWAAGSAWQQQQGFLGWGPVAPPETSRQR
jgi:hypothetical protein